MQFVKEIEKKLKPINMIFIKNNLTNAIFSDLTQFIPEVKYCLKN